MHSIKVLLALALFTAAAPAQFQFGVVCTTDSPFATEPNSSHRLGAVNEAVGGATDTVHFVYADAQAAWVRTGAFRFGRLTWGAPTLIGAGGRRPAIDCRPDGHRYVAWLVDDSAGSNQVYFRDLDTAMAPVRVSDPPYEGVDPDVFADDSGCAHIVWSQVDDDTTDIWYCTWYRGSLSAPVLVSSEPGYEDNTNPSISCFGDSGDIAVTWLAHDMQSPTPWWTKRRRLAGGRWQPVELVWHSSRELASPALDWSRGHESFGMCWVDSTTSGGYDVRYHGGNGGGYSTRWDARSPVVSHLGTTWSYLFWQDDSGGVSDIRTHFYYFMNGWDAGYSLRQFFGITENIWAPTCLGALVLWMQGEPGNYRVMYAFFDYPIAVAERGDRPGQRALLVRPNPVRARAHVTAPGPVSVYDRSGRLVRSAAPGPEPAVDLDLSSLPAGVYVIRSCGESAAVVKQ